MKNRKIRYYETLQYSFLVLIKLGLLIGLGLYCIFNFGLIGAIMALILMLNVKVGYPRVVYGGLEDE